MWKLPFFLGILFLAAACKSPPPPAKEASPPPAVPESALIIEVKEPIFTIIAIKIVQADLINTRLKLSLKIDNSNPCIITLSSFHYELFGNGRFWTDGVVDNLAVIPAESFAVTSFELEMNFIGMSRRLLDDIIALREVHYRIAGSMDMEPDIPGHPVSRVNFDFSGKSAVIH